MEYVSLWLDIIRDDTENQTVPTDVSGVESAGIKNEQILRFLNEAQEDIQRAIINEARNSNMFMEQESYTLDGSYYITVPTYAMLDGQIEKVEFLGSSNYYSLKQESIHQRTYATNVTGHWPEYYVREYNRIHLEPNPSTGTLRVTYRKRVPNLALRVGQIELYQPSLDLSVLESITLVDGTQNAAELARHQYLCVVDAQGTIKSKNVYFTDYDSSTRVITVDNHSLATDTLAIGDYVVLGKYATTHSELPYECKNYLISWANKALWGLDSNVTKVQMEQDKMNGLRSTILGGYSRVSGVLDFSYTDSKWDV